MSGRRERQLAQLVEQIRGDQDTYRTVVRAARASVEDCAGLWKEDIDELRSLPDEAILSGIEQHYSGGLRQFLEDSDLADLGGAR